MKLHSMPFRMLISSAFLSAALAAPLSAAAQAGSISLQASSYTLDQAGGNICFAVMRSGGSSGAVSVSYATSNGTAIAGTDYTAESGTLSWADGDSTTVNTITVPWKDVTAYSGSKTFTVTISSPTGGATLGTYNSTRTTVTDNLVSPSTYFSGLSGWKLALPIDIYGGTGGTSGSQFAAAEVTGTQLAAGFANADFYALSTGYLEFYDYSNGATTTPGSGSNHTRSEMREMYSGTGVTGNYEWTSATGGTINGQCSVKAVSADSDEATFMQIHGDSAAFFLLIYRPAKNDIALSYYATPTSTSGTIEEVLGSVALGATIHYTVVYSGNTVSLTVTVGSSTNTVSIDASAWAGMPVYFKYGAYHAAPNTGNPSGDYTRVQYTSVSVSHP